MSLCVRRYVARVSRFGAATIWSARCALGTLLAYASSEKWTQKQAVLS